MTPEERRDEIVRRLSAEPHGTSLGDLADTLGVAMRTIERDLDALREHGFEIESQRGRSGGIRMTSAPTASLSEVAPAGSQSARSSGAFGRPFVGRNAQLSQLRDALAGAASGDSGVMLVAGDPGIGKTRTLQELALFAQGAGFSIHWARCPEDRGAPPFWPWTQIIRSVVTDGTNDGGRARQSALFSGVPYPEHLSAIAPGIGIDSSGRASEASLTPDQVRFQTNASITGLLSAAGLVAPLLILIEDIHNGDVASLRLVEVLARDLIGAPVLIVGTYRDREFEPGDPLGGLIGNIATLPNFDRVHLTGLERTEVAELVRDITGARPSPRRLSDIFQRTSGNPFFVSEVAREPADLSQTSEIGRPLPRNVRDAVGVRLDNLPAMTSDYLSVAAVFGRDFDPAIVRLVKSQVAESDLANAADEAFSHQLIEHAADTGLLRFSHDIVRETIVSRIPACELMRAHLQIGEALESHYGDDAPDHADEIAHHFGEAGELADPGQTFTYNLVAGRRALALAAYFDAYGFLRTAVDIRGEQPSDDDAADALFGLGRTQEAVGVALGISHLDAAQSLRTAFEYYENTGNTAGVIAIAGRPYMSTLTQSLGDLFTRALEFAEPDSRDMGQILVAEGYSRWIRTHDISECLGTLEQASDIARRLDDPVLERSAAAVTANVAGMAGSWSESHRWAESALNMHTGAPDVESDIRCRIWRSNSLISLGDGVGAVEAAEEYIGWSGGIQNPFARSTALTVGSLAHGAVGNWGRIFELSVESSHIRALDIPLLRAVVLASYATGDFDSGRGFLEELIGKSQEQGPGHPAMRIYGGYPLEAYDFARQVAGDDAVEGLLDGALEVARSNTSDTQLADGGRVGWSALMAYHGGDAEEIENTYRQISALEGPFDPGGFSTARACSILAGELGLTREAGASMERAIADTNRAGYLPEFALLVAEHTEALSSQPGADREAISTLAGRGLEAATAIGMTPVVERLSALVSSPADSAPVDLPAGLTRREAEVLGLIASGKTNAEIADELVISEYTVMRHVSNTYAKIDASNRADATAFAIRNGLA